jgi:hypothetical protein
VPEQMTPDGRRVADLPLHEREGRLGVSRPDGPYAPEPDKFEALHARQLQAHVAAGDPGGARRLLNELEHGVAGRPGDPWRLLEAILLGDGPPAGIPG